MKKLWFKRKSYGWGWYPSSWEGWAVLGIYTVVVIGFALTINETSPPEEIAFTFILPTLLLTAALIRVCYRTGEKPRWQWGNTEDT